MVEIELLKRDGSDSLTIADDAIQSLNATLTNTGVGTFRATLKGDRRLERRAQRQDRVNIKTDGTKFAGYLLACPHTRSDGTTQIRGKGIAKKLQEGRPDTRPVVYDNVFAGDAIEDYWSRTPFGNATVTKQTADIVVQDSLEQSADTTTKWQNELQNISDTTPLFVENGFLKLAQSGFVRETENLPGVGFSENTDIDYSDGGAAQFVDLSSEVQLTISLDYEIPAENLEFYARTKEIDGTDSTDIAAYTSNDDLLSAAVNPQATLQWANATMDGVDAPSSYGPGDVDIKVQGVKSLNAYGTADIDLVAFVDNRFSYNFDNTVHEDNGYLDGPALYPTDANPVITTNASETTRNIANAEVTTTYNDTSNDQRISVSNDNGANFTRADNTNSLSTSFTTAGRELVTEFRLSGYDNGARNATPRFNYLGQEIDSFETKVDLDDRVVFVGVEASKNHFENLQKLHGNSDFVWTIEHDSSDPATMPVFSFPRGEETRTLDQINNNEIDESPAVEAEQFYNVIPLEGGLDSNGNRPFAEVKDQDSINDIGEEISPGLLRDPTISSDIEADFIAQALLRKAVANGELRGTKTIPPTFAPIPGFSYPVSWLDDPTVERTLEETSVTKSTNSAQTTLDFTGRTGFAQQIDELRRQARETQDEI